MHMPTRIPKTPYKWSAKISVITHGVKSKTSSFIISHVNAHSTLSYIQKLEQSKWFPASKVRNNTLLRTRGIPHLFPSMTLFAFFLNLFLEPGPCPLDFAKCNGAKISSLPACYIPRLISNKQYEFWSLSLRFLLPLITTNQVQIYSSTRSHTSYHVFTAWREEIFTPTVTWHMLQIPGVWRGLVNFTSLRFLTVVHTDRVQFMHNPNAFPQNLEVSSFQRYFILLQNYFLQLVEFCDIITFIRFVTNMAHCI
jgi:hypothetical protein